MAGHTLEEGLLVEDGVGGPAGVTCHVLLDVASQNVFYLFPLETSCK